MPRAQRFPGSQWHYTNYQTIAKRKSWAIIPPFPDFFPGWSRLAQRVAATRVSRCVVSSDIRAPRRPACYERVQPGRYCPPTMVAAERRIIFGGPALDPFSLCTSHGLAKQLNDPRLYKAIYAASAGLLEEARKPIGSLGFKRARRLSDIRPVDPTARVGDILSPWHENS